MPPVTKDKPTAPAATSLRRYGSSGQRVSKPQPPVDPLDSPLSEAGPRALQLPSSVVAQDGQKPDQAGVPKKDFKSVTVQVDKSDSDHTDYKEEDKMVVGEKRESSPGAPPTATVIPLGAPPIWLPFRPRCPPPIVLLATPSSRHDHAFDKVPFPNASELFPKDWFKSSERLIAEGGIAVAGPELGWSLWKSHFSGKKIRSFRRPQ